MQSTARVSPAQRSRILDLRATHLQRMEDIFRRRKDIVWELQHATVMPETASMRNSAFSKVRHFAPDLSQCAPNRLLCTSQRCWLDQQSLFLTHRGLGDLQAVLQSKQLHESLTAEFLAREVRPADH